MDGWLFSVSAGGWLDQERLRPGFVSRNRDDLREFLIIGQNECVNVLALSVPTVEKHAH